MIVIADTTPLHYLVLLNRAEILHELYGRVTVPEAVFRELQAASTPAIVKQWIANRPDWLPRLAGGTTSFGTSRPRLDGTRPRRARRDCLG